MLLWEGQRGRLDRLDQALHAGVDQVKEGLRVQANPENHNQQRGQDKTDEGK